MLLLAVDTSGAKGSIALSTGETLQDVEWTKKAMHSELATVELQHLLKDTNVDLKSLTHLAVNIGPGSFTGLRVGISLVKTLAYSLSLPVLTLNRLELLAWKNGRPGESIFVATKAVQDYYYCCAFVLNADRTPVESFAPQSCPHAKLTLLAAGSQRTLIEDETSGFVAETQAKDLIGLSRGASFKRPFSDWKSVEPLYIRGSEAEEKLKKGLLS